MRESEIPELLKIGPYIAVLPIIHGSAQCAVTVRRWLLEHPFDVVAVPLPPSFREQVEAAVLELPKPSIVIQRSGPDAESYQDSMFDDSMDYDEDEQTFETSSWNDSDDDEDEDDEVRDCSYVPIDPCQPVIMAIRAAMGEHIPREYIDLETILSCPMQRRCLIRMR